MPCEELHRAFISGRVRVDVVIGIAPANITSEIRFYIAVYRNVLDHFLVQVISVGHWYLKMYT